MAGAGKALKSVAACVWGLRLGLWMDLDLAQSGGRQIRALGIVNAWVENPGQTFSGENSMLPGRLVTGLQALKRPAITDSLHANPIFGSLTECSFLSLPAIFQGCMPCRSWQSFRSKHRKCSACVCQQALYGHC